MRSPSAMKTTYMGEADNGVYYGVQQLAGGGFRAVCIVSCEHFTDDLVGGKYPKHEDAYREAHDMALEWCLENNVNPGRTNLQLMSHIELFVPDRVLEAQWGTGERGGNALLDVQTDFSNYLDREVGEYCIAPWDWDERRVPVEEQIGWYEDSLYDDRERWGEYAGL